MSSQNATWEQLLERLKSDSASRQLPVDQLASESGLSPEIVSAILSGFQARISPRSQRTLGVFAWFAGVWSRVENLWERWMQKPVWLSIAIATITLAICLTLQVCRRFISPSSPSISFFLLELTGVLVVVALGSLLIATYRLGKSRYAFLFTGVAVVYTTFGFAVGRFFTETREFTTVRLLSSVGLAMLIGFGVLVLFGGAACTVTATSILMQAREQKTLVEKLNRRQLLAYYFELKRRLQDGPEEAIVVDPAWVIRLRQVVVPFGGILAITESTIVASLLFTIGFSGVDYFEKPPVEFPLWVQILIPLLSLVNIATMVLFAFVAERYRTVLALFFVSFLGSIVPYLVPIYPLGFSYIEEHSSEFFSSGLILFILVSVSHAISIVHFNAQHLHRRSSGDPAILVEEMVRVQRLLASGESTTTVMVIDVVGSTNMKRIEDPLVVEHCFAQYQQWIKHLVTEQNGRILSTSGDGAIATFESAPVALITAKRIQREVAWFNQTKNRLDSPFQMRIGLHSGDVSADVHDIEYTTVIDVAAHSEKVAPPGGIVATEAFITIHRPERIVPLNRVVDNWNIYLIETNESDAPATVDESVI